MLSLKHSWTLEYHYEFSFSIFHSPNLPAGPNQLKHLLNEFCFLKPCCKSETETVTHLWPNPIKILEICFCCMAFLLFCLISQKICKHFFLLLFATVFNSQGDSSQPYLLSMACEWRTQKEAHTPRFGELVSKFCVMRRLRKDDNNIDVNVVIDQLNAFRIDSSAAVSVKVGLVIFVLCYHCLTH